jgi:hypothetical protein
VPPFRIRFLLPLLLAAAVSACARPPSPAETAQDFWDAVVAGELARAVALGPGPGEDEPAQRLRERLGAFPVEEARVEALEVPPEASLALLPTTIVRAGADGGRWEFETVTVLERAGGQWRVAVDDTLDRGRQAALEATGERVRDAARRLSEAAGESAEELARSAESLARALSEQLRDEVAPRIAEETRERSEALADDMADALGRAGEELTRALEGLEQALRERGEEGAPEGEEPGPE